MSGSPENGQGDGVRAGSRAAHEEWRAVPGYEGLYEVSSSGRFRTAAGRILSTNGRDKDGYPVVALTKDRKRRTFVLHTLVCKAFHGPSMAPHREVAHLDGCRTNCRADNLKWVGKIQNHHHKRLHGTHQAGEKHPRARLTTNGVSVIKRRLIAGESCSRIAADYPVSAAAIYDIKRGKNWR